ncbi:MAG TPA: formate dehydrogenase accessory sulfurtransferase FdhD [Vicinamibacterales bacterium]|jgi:FdhD protein|nr:formate dehydrogenase accessory sulfurtransferase FdhD [Vicinamibacterales bacterium]
MTIGAVRPFDVLQVDGATRRPATDRVAAEVALEVRLNSESFAIVMRTPGDDEALAAGFLFSEGVVTRREDIVSIAVDAAADIADVTLSPDRATDVPRLLAERRQVATSSSCGMCGRRSLDLIGVDVPPLVPAWQVDPAVISSLPDALRAAQRVFDETGGIHAAGLFTCAGALEAAAEDVGRHNAVDKLVGRALLDGRLPLSNALLCVSGRTSFEIVQKALMAGIGLVAAVSAPSSLAVELARDSGLTLLGFVRGGRFNVYAHEERIGARSSS